MRLVLDNTVMSNFALVGRGPKAATTGRTPGVGRFLLARGH
jgi:hypothetical protein